MLCLLFPAVAWAEIYKYVDENGNVTLTDTPRGGNTVLLYEGPGKDGGRNDVHRIIVKKAGKYRLDPSLISAVITAESAFDPGAVSRKGAMGLMQLMPGTARDLGVRNPFNPEENIEGGTRYLKYLIEKFDGDLTRALAAYNAGPRRVESSGRLPEETTNYIRKVYSIYKGERRVEPAGPEEKTVIYKVVLDDGKVIITNHIPKNAL
jgi:soluble lytic murein transglycosylase